jgi:hypothetical protein
MHDCVGQRPRRTRQFCQAQRETKLQLSNLSAFDLATGDATIHSNPYAAAFAGAGRNCRIIRLPCDQSHFGISRRNVSFVQCLGAHVENASTPNSIYVALSDAGVLGAHHLMTDQGIMAHGVYSTDSDAALLRRRGTAMAHCPLSIFSLWTIYCRVVNCCNETIDLEWVRMWPATIVRPCSTRPAWP